MVRPNGFTLIELLVVITIVVVLLALLTPALDKAISSAGTARCLANQHAIGQALAFYLNDHKQRYPVMNIWWNLMGDAGDISLTRREVTQRPLNAYLGYTSDGTKVPVARCLADIGDPTGPYKNMYEVAGTSYLPAYFPIPTEPKGDTGVKMVFGHSGGLDPETWGTLATSRSTPVPSAKHTSLSPTQNKVINADWNWLASRSTGSEQTRWHRPDSPERLMSTLFADTHAELFDWDRQWVEDYNNNVSTPNYSPSWKWW